MSQTAEVSLGVDEHARSSEHQTIDRWQLDGLLGEGQWTYVYQARPEGCPDDWPSDYAVKVLRNEYERDEFAVCQIRREAQAGRLVTDPHLIAFLSEHVDQPPYHLVMPFLPGTTLGSLLVKTRRICLPQALWITRQTAEALRTLHLAGWMHADVKPSNIFVAPQGHVTLIDLGFARNFETPNDPSAELVGTLNYAAPEVFISARGRDGQSDIYSLGVTLFEMLTQRLPFVNDDASELALAHLREQPPDPRKFTPNVPPRVARVVKRMLAKEPLRRPEAKELVALLMELEIESFDEREGTE